MARMRVKAGERREFFRAIGDEVSSLRADQTRRFRNALLALALSDPRWMIWVENNLPPRLDEIGQDMDTWLTLIEAAARWRVLASYGFFHHKFIAPLLFRRDWAFTDRGALSPG